ncbi:hypothetical protein [Fodinibius salsisoli]|uniref:Uncharacterized protein n=1 Tax=Fodinibius salsisoli TaxID=2820877 RepID=A0ABT3PKD4_9BACT|nr:hypothetical protein [Fodinibius salsisoli]MCW9706379.1 hypothetical protein [Fodinibius salsisoli]
MALKTQISSLVIPDLDPGSRSGPQRGYITSQYQRWQALINPDADASNRLKHYTQDCLNLTAEEVEI